MNRYISTSIHPSIHPSFHTSIHIYIHPSIQTYIHTRGIDAMHFKCTQGVALCVASPELVLFCKNSSYKRAAVITPLYTYIYKFEQKRNTSGFFSVIGSSFYQRRTLCNKTKQRGGREGERGGSGGRGN